MEAVFGYYKWNKDQGQARICFINRPEDHIAGFVQLNPLVQHAKILSAIPVVNIFSGTLKIIISIQGNWNDERTHIHREDFTKYRLYTFIAGLAELTLVGGWILHGGATIYYYVQYKSHQHEII